MTNEINAIEAFIRNHWDDIRALAERHDDHNVGRIYGAMMVIRRTDYRKMKNGASVAVEVFIRNHWDDIRELLDRYPGDNNVGRIYGAMVALKGIGDIHDEAQLQIYELDFGGATEWCLAESEEHALELWADSSGESTDDFLPDEISSKVVSLEEAKKITWLDADNLEIENLLQEVKLDPHTPRHLGSSEI